MKYHEKVDLSNTLKKTPIKCKDSTIRYFQKYMYDKIDFKLGITNIQACIFPKYFV